MNVYLGISPQSISKDSLTALPHNAIVMTKAKDAHLLQLDDVRTVGDKVVGYRK